MSEGTDAAAGAEPKKRGRFKIIEEEVPGSRHPSVSKVPSSADLGKGTRGLAAAAGGSAGLLAELARLHEQAAAHQAGLARLIDGVKASSSSGAPAAAAALPADGDSGTPASTAPSTVPSTAVSSGAGGSVSVGVVRKLSATGSISRSTSSRALASYPELARVNVAMLLPSYDNDATELAERLLERGQELERRAADSERRLGDALEENRALRRQLGIPESAAAAISAAAAAGAAAASADGDSSRAASRRVSTAAYAATASAAVGVAAAAAANGGLGERYSSAGSSAESSTSSAGVGRSSTSGSEAPPAGATAARELAAAAGVPA